jgi:hypothetical protein
MSLPRDLGAAFSAGAFGGLINGLCAWFFGQLGITQALGVKIAPGLSAAMLYPRIVWGGLWGFLFLLGWPGGSAWRRGLTLSLGPTIFQLLYIFPVKAGKGLLGLELGLLTPAFVILFNAVWGLAVVAWFRLSGQRA